MFGVIDIIRCEFLYITVDKIYLELYSDSFVR